MSLKPVIDRYQAWRRSVEATCEQLFTQARAQLVAAQRAPDADAKIERIEELLRAKIEPVLLESEPGLEPIQQDLERIFSVIESPSEQESAFQDQVGQGVEPLRDRVERRVASLVAQARANELQPSAPGAPAAAGATPPAAPPGPADAAPPPGMLRFCVSCGAKLGTVDWSARRCSHCSATL